MVIQINGSSGRGVVLALEEKMMVFGGKEGGVENTDLVFNVLKGIGPVNRVILKGIDPISSLPIEGRSMKEVSIRITLCKSVNSGFQSPEFLFLEKDKAEFFGGSNFKFMEKRAVGIVGGTLDST